MLLPLPALRHPLAQNFDFAILERQPGIRGRHAPGLFRRDSFDQLAALPRSGHSRKDLTSRDVLFWPVQPYLVVYRDKGTMIQIVAVLHGARDIPSLLENR